MARKEQPCRHDKNITNVAYAHNDVAAMSLIKQLDDNHPKSKFVPDCTIHPCQKTEWDLYAKVVARRLDKSNAEVVAPDGLYVGVRIIGEDEKPQFEKIPGKKLHPPPFLYVRSAEQKYKVRLWVSRPIKNAPQLALNKPFEMEIIPGQRVAVETIIECDCRHFNEPKPELLDFMRKVNARTNPMHDDWLKVSAKNKDKTVVWLVEGMAGVACPCHTLRYTHITTCLAITCVFKNDYRAGAHLSQMLSVKWVNDWFKNVISVMGGKGNLMAIAVQGVLDQWYYDPTFKDHHLRSRPYLMETLKAKPPDGSDDKDKQIPAKLEHSGITYSQIKDSNSDLGIKVFIAKALGVDPFDQIAVFPYTSTEGSTKYLQARPGYCLELDEENDNQFLVYYMGLLPEE